MALSGGRLTFYGNDISNMEVVRIFGRGLNYVNHSKHQYAGVKDSGQLK